MLLFFPPRAAKLIKASARQRERKDARLSTFAQTQRRVLKPRFLREAEKNNKHTNKQQEVRCRNASVRKRRRGCSG